MENQLDSVTEKPTCFLRLQGLACDWSKHNKHSGNIFSVHGFLRLSVNAFLAIHFLISALEVYWTRNQISTKSKLCYLFKKTSLTGTVIEIFSTLRFSVKQGGSVSVNVLCKQFRTRWWRGSCSISTEKGKILEPFN